MNRWILGKSTEVRQPRIAGRVRLFRLWFLAGCVFITSCGTEGERPGPDGSVEDPYLKTAGAEWDRLFNERRLPELAALYAEDAISMPFNAPTVNGRQALQAELESFLSTNTAKHETRIEEVLATPTWAIERARYTMTYTPVSGGAEIVERGRHVMRRKLQNGRRLIAWEIWNAETPAVP